MIAQNKTRPIKVKFAGFLDTIQSTQVRDDCLALLKMIRGLDKFKHELSKLGNHKTFKAMKEVR